MKSSCISHPPKTPLVIIREEYLVICDGDHCEAAILNQFEYWTNIKLGYQEQAEVEGEIARAGGAEVPPSDLWIYKSQTELHEELMGLFGIRAVGTALQSLVDRGFLERRNNPKYAWDRTYQYRLQATKVQDAILHLCKIEKSGMQSQSQRKDDIESDQNKPALSETTTETTSKETTEKTDSAFPEKKERDESNPDDNDIIKVRIIHEKGKPHVVAPDEIEQAILDDIIEQTRTHPGPLEVAARTEAAQAEAGGNPAVPPPAGGSDGFQGGPVDAFCEVLAAVVPNQLPKKQRKSWGLKLGEIAKEWSGDDRTVTPEIMEAAIRAVPEDEFVGWRSFSSPYSDNFDKHIGPLLLSGGKPRQKGNQHGPHQRHIAKGAAPRRVATEDEARAILGDRP